MLRNFAKIGGKRVQLEDHSIFVAFAPKDNPKIAIAIMIENGGYGATIAGPIASLMIEKCQYEKSRDFFSNEIKKMKNESRWNENGI